MMSGRTLFNMDVTELVKINEHVWIVSSHVNEAMCANLIITEQ